MKIEVVNHDITTESGWKSYVDGWLEAARRRATDDELKFTEAALLVTRDWQTGEVFAQPKAAVVIGFFVGDTDEEVEMSKEMFAGMARMHAIAGLAVASLVLSEAWMAVPQSPAQARDPGFRASKAANRREILFAMVTHRAFSPKTRMVTSLIKRERKRRILAPWSWTDSDMNVGGRLADFTLPEGIENRPDYPLLVERSRNGIRELIDAGECHDIPVPTRSES